MHQNEIVQQWQANVQDETLRQELDFLLQEGNESDLADAFFQDLAFGTAGLRGIIGVGSNRMNIYTVGKATQGLADYLNRHFENPSVAIARDSRINGELFVQIAASVLAANGIVAHLYPRVEPTPALSWAVRDLQCSAGICMTASHNPAAYNGYKAYGPDGCQITTQAAEEIQEAIRKIDPFKDVKLMDFEEALEQNLVRWIGEDTLDRFIDAVAEQSLEPTNTQKLDVSVVYTPLNGTGLECVSRVLDRIGVTDVTLVPEQAIPDGNFPTCPSPNPEIRSALERGLAVCETAKPYLLLATDPDADRVGIAVAHEGEYHLLSGNEVGILLLDYLCQRRLQLGKPLEGSLAVSTIVSSAMVDAIALEYGIELRRTLTGFKYIGDQITALEANGQEGRFIFGFEESYGYLSGPHVRDKDAVNASMIICQMAAWHKAQGKDLLQAMHALYEHYGYYQNGLINIAFPGAEGAREMARLVDGLRTNPPATVGEWAVERFTDYANGAAMPGINLSGPAQTLPSANVLQFDLANGRKVIIRPSGTEPKVKAYLFACEPDASSAAAAIQAMDEAVRKLLG